ncbi:MerC domain-containing protein [Lysobacter enzymogenes]|uniref:MerC domain-containing protein n=1 Tax=Lysobacter enzymogenes TaxID=69 RepID=UPI001AF32CE3|nr:MerC domain-containing protein [Lysobacter enzymogenes]QQQ00007.1 MerC domain-containing protein [Lysobacter enzymogenes]
MSDSPSRSLIDRIGALGSLLCAVHCALLPLAIALIPSLGLVSLASDRFELAFVAFATVLGAFSLIWGYRRHHAVRALWLLVPGLALLWVGVLYAPLHHSVVPHAIAMTIGGALVGLAHLANLRLNHGHIHSASCAH